MNLMLGDAAGSWRSAFSESGHPLDGPQRHGREEPSTLRRGRRGDRHVARVEAGKQVLAITRKRLRQAHRRFDEFRVQSRGGKGIKAMSLTDKTGLLAAQLLVQRGRGHHAHHRRRHDHPHAGQRYLRDRPRVLRACASCAWRKAAGLSASPRRSATRTSKTKAKTARRKRIRWIWTSAGKIPKRSRKKRTNKQSANGRFKGRLSRERAGQSLFFLRKRPILLFRSLTVNEQIRNFAQIPITGARCAPLQCCGKKELRITPPCP